MVKSYLKAKLDENGFDIFARHAEPLGGMMIETTANSGGFTAGAAGSSGVFVAIEGIDGAGKSRAIGRIRDAPWFTRSGAVLLDKRTELSEGYLAPHSATLRRLLWGERAEDDRNVVPDLHWVHLSAAWFVLMDQRLIRPALDEGRLVLADSWVAKQIARFALKPPPIPTALSAALAHVSRPDCVVYLDADPELAASRKTTFGYSETGQFDGYVGVTRENFIAYQNRVRRSYLDMADHSWRILTADNGDPAEAAEALVRGILTRSRPSDVAP